MGIKERRTKILLGIFLISDVSFNPIEFDERFLKIVDLSLNQKTKGTISGLLKEGSLIKKETNGTVRYSLTEEGFHTLCLEFPYFRFLKDSWDNKWRVLSYEIPEKKRDLRDRLRREVAGWGLGPWHRSFWLTPHPVITNLKKLVTGREEEKYIQAFEAEHSFGDRELLIEKVWGKSQLDKLYRALFKRWHEILSKEEDKLDKFKKVITEYITVLRRDPGLPKELLGETWIGFEAFNIYKEIRTILLA